MPEGLLCRRDFTSHFLWSADKGSSSAGPFLEQLSKLWRKLGALDKLKHKTEVVDRRRDVRPEACQLVPRERAPAYLKRPFILSGYLIGGTSSEAAWRTSFGWNNETLNAWTMTPGCVIAFVGLLQAREHLPTEEVVFWIFLMSSLLHAPCSIRLHLTIGTSEEARNLWRTFDVFFIFTCAVFRAIALGWYVFPQWQNFSAYVTATLGVYVHNIYKYMIRRKIKDIPKTSIPKALASSIFCYSFPGMVASYREIQTDTFGQISQLVTLILIFIAIGGLSYGCKVPERWAPGFFDTIGNGHQVMHVAICLEYSLELVLIWTLASQKLLLEGHDC